MMTCPKCGMEQKAGDECLACGIIIEKYRKRLAEAGDRQVQNDARDGGGAPERRFFFQRFLAPVADPVEKWVGRYSDRLDEKFGIAWRDIMPSAGRQTFHWFRGFTDRLITLLLSACFP